MQFLMLFTILFPALAALGIWHEGISGHLKTLHSYVMTATLINSAALLFLVFAPQTAPLHLFSFTEKLQMVLAVDGLSRVFILIIAVLWPITVYYVFDYMAHEGSEGKFFAFFLLSFGVSAGIALAGNLVTLYLFFEMLTLATLPLVMHKMDDRARYAGKRYLLYSMTGAAFGFIAIIFTQFYGSGGTFTMGGILNDGLSAASIQNLRIAFTLAFFGFGVKAALLPMSFWLPAASVAPTPVTALLHAAAVVKAGAFACIRLTFYTYDPTLLAGTFAQYIPMIFAIATIVFGSYMALRNNHLKRRLAWSTVSNLSYILFSVLLMTESGLLGGCMHMLAHAAIKITLFFCIGSVLVSTGKEYLNEISGLYGTMPRTFFCFAIASVSLMGVPPAPGFCSKWLIGSAAVELGGTLPLLGVGALMLSTVLTAIYLMTIVAKATFPADGVLQRGKPVEKRRMVIAQTILCVLIATMGLMNNTLQSTLAQWLF